MTSRNHLEIAALALTAADIDDWKRRHRPAANWEKWTHCAQAELWQCVALSFDVEPVAATMLAVEVPFFIDTKSKPRPWFAEHPDMRERLEIAVANAGSDALSRLHPLADQSGEIACRRFLTGEFGDWARSIWRDRVPAKFPGQLVPLISTGTEPTAESIRHLLAPGDGLSVQPSLATPTKLRTEKAGARHDRLLREILMKLGLDPAAIPRARGGAKKSEPKQRAFAMALTPDYAGQGLTDRTFRAAWERLPKVG